MGGNLENPDRLAYLDNYTYISQGRGDPNFEPGYQFLAMLGNMLGLPYSIFNTILIFIGLLLIGSTIRRFSDRPTLILSMYALYPMFWDYVQTRNFLALAIITYTSRYLIGQRKSAFFYSIGITAATSMHISSAIFLIFLIALISRSWHFYTITGLFLGIYLFSIDLIISNQFLYFLIAKIESYTTTQTSETTKAAVAGIYLFTLCLIMMCLRILETNPRKTSPNLIKNSHKNIDIIDTKIIGRIFILSVFFLPLAMINLDFMRLFRNMFIICTLTFDAALQASRKIIIKTTLRISIAVYLGICLIGLVWFLSLSDIISPLFLFNILST